MTEAEIRADDREQIARLIDSQAREWQWLSEQAERRR